MSQEHGLGGVYLYFSWNRKRLFVHFSATNQDLETVLNAAHNFICSGAPDFCKDCPEVDANGDWWRLL